MPTMPLTVQVPGKLMIAGEFAVLEKYQKLVVMAVDRFVYAIIQESKDNRLSLPSFGLSNLEWEYEASQIHLKTEDSRVRFVEDAMTVVYTYLKENHINPSSFHLSIRSELDDKSGRKYGLGSSAAVVTSVVAAILKKFIPERATDTLLFKLAAVSHVKTQGSGSGADVAASSYGGWFEFSSFQADWLLASYEKAASITELVTMDWPYFSQRPIKLPDDIYMCIGWTGSPASTSKLIEKIDGLKSTDYTLYEQFLNDSQTAINTFLQGVDQDNAALVMEGIRQNRHALATVGKHAHAEIETPILKTLCDLAEAHGGAGKPSGAGGGDCGIAFMSSEEQAEQLMEAWIESGIQPLSIKPHDAGAALL